MGEFADTSIRLFSLKMISVDEHLNWTNKKVRYPLFSLWRFWACVCHAQNLHNIAVGTENQNLIVCCLSKHTCTLIEGDVSARYVSIHLGICLDDRLAKAIPVGNGSQCVLPREVSTMPGIQPMITLLHFECGSQVGLLKNASFPWLLKEYCQLKIISRLKGRFRPAAKCANPFWYVLWGWEMSHFRKAAVLKHAPPLLLFSEGLQVIELPKVLPSSTSFVGILY